MWQSLHVRSDSMVVGQELNPLNVRNIDIADERSVWRVDSQACASVKHGEDDRHAGRFAGLVLPACEGEVAGGNARRSLVQISSAA